jgi:hypothetical protein
MRKLFRYTLALLVTAACGAAKQAAAQDSAPVVSNFATVTTAAPAVDALALPRVVPPRPSAPSTNPIRLVSTTEPKPAVDLLAAPTVPPAWLATPGKLAVIPSGLPTQPPAKLSPPVPVAAAPKVVLTPLAHGPVIPVVSGARLTLQSLTAAPRLARCWPPAHLVRKNVQDQETSQATYIDAAPQLKTPELVP